MNIIIPVGGKGERFKNAGYINSKPLINIFEKQMIFYVLDNLNINTDEIDENLLLLIKKKIKIDQLWNDLIIKKYAWKININMNEIDKKINNNYKDDNKSKEKFKETLIFEERKKKLVVFSKYHLNILKKQSLIKYIE